MLIQRARACMRIIIGVNTKHDRQGLKIIIHGLRHCVEEPWMDEDFVVMKINMHNAFNLVSRQAIS